MEKEGLSYHEALLHLAKKYGIEVIERELTDEERARQSAREAMFVANEWAMRKMESDMTETEEGRDVGLQYFTQRGVTDSAIKAFHLGYALDQGNALTKAAAKAGFDLNVLKKLGLIGTSQQGRIYDRFRGRVIFPILNTAGKVIAFGGRDLKGGLAKYINSPESDLYKKSNELYGIFQAKSSIVSENRCFLVEGYMDVIGMWQSGMRNVVASSGTALTDGQIAMIHRFTENITLIYDGDAAGIKASLRGIDMLLSHKLNVKLLLLPDGEDPDSFARKHTPEEFKAYVAAHETDIIRYKAEVLLNTVKNDPRNRITAINSVIESIAHIPDQVSRDVYVQECSTILGIAESTIARAVGKARVALVEKLKKERTRRNFPVNTSTNGEPPAEPSAQKESSQAQSGESSESLKSGLDSTSGRKERNADETIRHPLYPLELTVIKYCVRYAFLNFCTYEEDPEDEADGEKRLVSLDVLDFVREELADSNLTFTVELFNKIFNLLQEMRPSFEKYIDERMAEVDRNLDIERREGYSRIGESNLSMEEIKREEQKLEDSISIKRENALKEYSKEYPGRVLGSHEDADVREMTLELVFEKYHLSNIYLKDGVTELEEDKLNVLLVRAIDEWKNELINLRIKNLLKQFRDITGKGNLEEEQRIQLELSSLMATRAEMAKYIGERILSNRRGGV